MNHLSVEKRIRVIASLVEGASINATCRMTGVAKHTVLKLLKDLGCAAAAYHHRNVRNLRVRHLQCDEIWSFVGAKRKNVRPEKREEGWGDIWTWTAIDSETKLCVSYLMGGRGLTSAREFMLDCASRIVGRPQITTDSHSPYFQAVEEAFGADADYAMLHKIYAAPVDDESRRYGPATCIGCDMKTVSGNPDPQRVSTSHVERHNLTMRMSMRRFTRLTNGFSKKLENHGHALALYFMHYSFCKVHTTLRVTPAMEAGIADHVWGVEELLGLLEQNFAAKAA
jgi:IS1 family transposase